jgi:hypothetical protein
MKKTTLVLAFVAGLTSFAGNAKAAIILNSAVGIGKLGLKS